LRPYYQVLFPEAEEPFGVAWAEERQELFFLPESGCVEGWKPLTMQLRDGEFSDYLGNNLGCRLCSPKLRSILETRASASDRLQWLNVFVTLSDDIREYFILHFPTPIDCLDPLHTIRSGDFVVKPVLAAAAVSGHDVFTYPGSGELCWFVSDTVKGAIKSARCTGLMLSKAPMR
jgi:hypothetical protein